MPGSLPLALPAALLHGDDRGVEFACRDGFEHHLIDLKNVLQLLPGLDGRLFAVQRKGALPVADLGVSANRLAIAVYQAIIAFRHERPWLKLKQGHTDPVRWREYQDDHRKIADALLARNAVAATAAIRSHLVKVRAKMLGQ
jgi:hypothetical protein